jgi:hypothetical protein
MCINILISAFSASRYADKQCIQTDLSKIKSCISWYIICFDLTGKTECKSTGGCEKGNVLFKR